jgi:hypothetical protein
VCSSNQALQVVAAINHLNAISCMYASQPPALHSRIDNTGDRDVQTIFSSEGECKLRIGY